jgi:hypothetical protein
MKCVKCGEDSKKKDRADGTCPKCGTRFALDPTAGDVVTDMAVHAAIERVSAGGHVRFLADHVVLDLLRRAKPGSGLVRTIGFGIVAVVGVLLAAVFAVGGPMEMVALAFAPLVVALALIVVGGASPPATPEKLAAAVSKYLQVHGKPKGLIDMSKPRLPPSKAVLAELESYSFDRAVICDTRENAEILLANDFHFENNCAVLTIDGYPAGVFEVVRKMIRANPKIEVFALHDCTPEGLRVQPRLTEEEAWFKGRRVVDVALNPSQAEAFREAWLPTPRIVGSGPWSPSDAAWLREWTLRLAAIPPYQLIKRLFRAMQQGGADSETAMTAGGDGGGGDGFVPVPFTAPASSSDGGGDNFG